MLAEYDGQQIVGIDLHRRRSVIVWISETGERLDQTRIDNDPMTLASEIAKAGEHPQVVLEAVSQARLRSTTHRLGVRRSHAARPACGRSPLWSSTW